VCAILQVLERKWSGCWWWRRWRWINFIFTFIDITYLRYIIFTNFCLKGIKRIPRKDTIYRLYTEVAEEGDEDKAEEEEKGENEEKEEEAEEQERGATNLF
jgi:hypothetical protein